jgi:hypothetical protein
MKYLNVILTVVALLLAVIAMRLWTLSVSVDNFTKSNMFLINAQQAGVAVQQNLAGDIQDLRNQIKEISGKIVVKQ